MWFQNIREEIQFRLREISGSEIFWTQAELNTYINDAQLDIVRRTECLWGLIIFNVGYGDYAFTLPDNVYEIPKLRVVFDEDNHLIYITPNQLTEVDDDYENANPGTPKYWYYRGTNTLYIYPPATSAEIRTYNFSAETGRIVRATSSDRTYTFLAETGRIVKFGNMRFSSEFGRIVRIQPNTSRGERYIFSNKHGKIAMIEDDDNTYTFSGNHGKIARIQDDNSGGDQYIFTKNKGIIKKIESPIGNLNVKYVKKPVILEDDNDEFEIHDVFKYAVIKYVCYKALEEPKESQNLEVSGIFFKEYADELGRIMPVAKSRASSRQARITSPDLNN